MADQSAETPGLDPDELSYYRLTESWNDKFWRRTGGPGSLAGAACLDLGCGVGALTTDLIRRGAARAVGLDPDADRIRIARLAAQAFHPELSASTEYRATRVQDLDGAGIFDVIVSRDTFEHIHDLPDVLGELARLLKPGGRVYVGFGPLYRSPFGDHGLLGVRLPWLHLLVAPLPNKPRMGRWPSDRQLETLDTELNGLTLAEICKMIEQSPLRAEELRVNVSDHPAVRLLDRARRIKALREFLSVNVYLLLRHADLPGEHADLPGEVGAGAGGPTDALAPSGIRPRLVARRQVEGTLPGLSGGYRPCAIQRPPRLRKPAWRRT